MVVAYNYYVRPPQFNTDGQSISYIVLCEYALGIIIGTLSIVLSLHVQKERRTALMFAAKNGVFSIVKLLLKFKSDVNIRDSVSHTSGIVEFSIVLLLSKFSLQSLCRATKLLSILHRLPRSDTVSKRLQ